MVPDGGRGGNTTKEIGLSPPVHSEAIGNWSSSTAGAEAAARVVAGDEDEPEVTGVALPWAEVGHSEGTVTVAAGMLSGTPDSSVRAWTIRALARVNGISDGLPEDFSEVAESLVGLDGMADTLPWGTLTRDVEITGDIFPVFGSCGSLNHSSVTNCIRDMSMCDSHNFPPIVSILREGSALAISKSRHGSGSCSSRALNASMYWLNSTAPLGDVARMPVLMRHRRACRMMADLVRGMAATVAWGRASGGERAGALLNSAMEGTESWALSLMRIVSS